MAIDPGVLNPNIELTHLQSKVFKAYVENKYRFIVCCFGRRSGKTILNAAIIRQAALVEKDGVTPAKNKRIWYVTDTREHAEDLIWEELKAIIPKQYLAAPPQNNALRIKLVNGSEIRLKSADNPDALVGKGLDLLCIDEAALVKVDAWRKVLPTLADKKGKCLITSTPRGMDNWFYDVHSYHEQMESEHDEDGKFVGMKRKFPDWISFSATTAEAGIVDLSEIERDKKIMDAKTFQEEYLATFMNASGRVYYAFDRAESCKEECIDDGWSDLHIGMDFNVDPMSAVVSIKRNGVLHVIDEIVIKDSNTPEMAEEINNRYKDRKIYVYPDASGARRDTRSYRQENSDHQILKDAGFIIVADKKNPDVVDRVASVNGALLNADGVRRVFIHPSCTQVINSLSRQTYKEGTRIPKKDGWDHMNDALGYLLHHTFPSNPKKKKFVKSRKVGIV